ncbi:hypothetical protein MPER_12978 [Moniliophthora perniciosa FA553]|nr:hypothetical protein MPER_12978 [Moniliophthora perniciosa FA553]
MDCCFWEIQLCIRESRLKWKKAFVALGELSETKSADLASEARRRLGDLPWKGRLQGFEDYDDISVLADYCTTSWLKTGHVNQMIDLIADAVCPNGTTIHLAHTYLSEKVIEAYGSQEEYPVDFNQRWVRKLAQDMATGVYTTLGTIVNVGGNHWVPLVVDFEKQMIYYGDSLGHSVNTRLKDSFSWWTYQHTRTNFQWQPMAITHQNDGFSCSVLAANALAHNLSAGPFPLIPETDAVNERLRTLLKVISRHNNKSFSNKARGFEFTFQCELPDPDDGDFEFVTRVDEQDQDMPELADVDSDSGSDIDLNHPGGGTTYHVIHRPITAPESQLMKGINYTTRALKLVSEGKPPAWTA